VTNATETDAVNATPAGGSTTTPTWPTLPARLCSRRPWRCFPQPR